MATPQHQSNNLAGTDGDLQAALASKYGGLKPKNGLLAKVRCMVCPPVHPRLRAEGTCAFPQDHKYFDSADWALAKEGKQDAAETTGLLPLPRPRPAAVHRLSKLEARS